MSAPKFSRKFTVTSFWALIEQTRPTRHGKLEAHGRFLKRALKDLPDGDLAAFTRHFAATFCGLDRWDLWGAGNVLQGGWMGDDGFTGFRNWIILHGRTAHDALQKHPEALLDLDLSPYRTPHLPVSEIARVDLGQVDGGQLLKQRLPASQSMCEAHYRLVYNLQHDDLDMTVMEAYEKRFKGRDYFEDVYVPGENPTHPNGWERDQGNARAYYPTLAAHLDDLNRPVLLRPRAMQRLP